jgi:hypothetical protein
LDDALPSLDFVIEEWPRLQTKWEAWADAATDADVAWQVPFKSRLVGNAGLPAWQIVMHVVNHATLHRGQIVGMLRQFGVEPPTTDIVFYHYEQAAAAAKLARFATPQAFASTELCQADPKSAPARAYHCRPARRIL